MIYLDSNILIYSVASNPDDTNQQIKAREIVSNNNFILSELSILELSFVLKKLRENDLLIRKSIEYFSNFVKSKNIIKDYVNFTLKNGGYKHSFDIYHILFAKELSCEKLLTFDKGFKQFQNSIDIKIEIL